MRSAWVISTGTELTLGQGVDANGAWLAARLAELGIRTQRLVTVADDAAEIRDVVLQAAGACDVILLSGGLGPTEDDLTRKALAEAAGVPLEIHPPTLEHLRMFFAARGRAMPQANKVQALVPKTGAVLPNTCGTAPGIRIDICGKPCFALPGVPYEMQTMFEREVGPQLRLAAGGSVLLSRKLNACGPGESDVAERIADLMQPGRDVAVGTVADLGIVGIRLSVRAATRQEGENHLDAVEAELRRRLGAVIFGRDDDTLAGVVGELLAARGQSLSTAESCTGGLIGALITDVPGSSRYYKGGVVAYANSAKSDLLAVDPAGIERHGAVSEPVAQRMAEGAARVFCSDYALSVTGIAGPSGGTPVKPVGLAFMGLRTPAQIAVRQHRFGDDSPRHAIRVRAARAALNMLRLELLHVDY